jgi:KDO2-lipid IV(A) lauroyltransferase
MKKKKKQNKHLKKLRYFLEAVLTYTFYYIFQLIPVVLASKIGYFLGRTLVSFFVGDRKEEAIKNILLSFPEKTLSEAEEIFAESCGFFVATIFEIPRLKDLANRITIIDEHNTLENIKNNKSLIFSAHIGNWEMFLYPFVNLTNKSFAIYKKPNNYFLESFFLKIRNPPKTMDLIRLNREKLIYLHNQIKNSNVFINMLVDQKIREGIAVDFLGRPAYTSTFFSVLALKHNLPLTPVHVIRDPNCKFRIILEKPINIIPSGNKEEDIKNLTILMNSKIEEWIKENPSQWLWLHKRW